MTILLAWNPARFAWGDLRDELAQSRSNESADNSWSVGNRRDIPPNSRFFIIRLGVEPRGIIASGRTTSVPYNALHWDKKKASAGLQTRYVDIVFDHLFEEPTISYNELQNPPLNNFHWSTQMSGVDIPDKIAIHLELIWKERTESVHRGHPEEYGRSIGLNEGSIISVYVNRYERNPKARLLCLKHHGTACYVCGQRMSEMYEGVLDELIHTHHIIPISSIRKEYKINPIKDMIPVCPNCHSVIHSQSPPLTIDDVRKRKKIKSK